MTIQNNGFLQALARQPVERTPVWMMRQAGRYLPEYRALRQQATDFMAFCKTPELAIEATLQPLRRFDLDASIIFSDILVIPEAMGMDLQFIANEGPYFSSPIRLAQDIERLTPVVPEDHLDYVLEAIKGVKKELTVPLIGFAGSPWTVACYMVEGAGSKTFRHVKTLLYREPALLHRLLEKLALATTDYLNAQIKVGANAVMLFDTWGSVLSGDDYQHFSLHYMTMIAQNLIREYKGQTIPVTFFTKGGGLWLEAISQAGCDALGLDWTMDIANARERVGDRVALQGNLDPFVLYGTPALIRAKVTAILDKMKHHPGHIFNLGHGIDKDTPVESVEIMLDTVRSYQPSKATV